MAFLIGDTVRLGATIKNFDGEEEAPASITVTIYREDGETKVLNVQPPNLKAGTTAQYYYDWTILGSLTVPETLIVLWDWTGPHKKTLNFEVIPAV